ncbi:aldehyde dehydrogenase family protein [Aneurinibacillus sp. UBA3580]|jgi:aldehyde dehydrogenase (NAD+)/phenylacetaldehyde dehydrogenase|uniref:aldehyde dehydrogenase family protein n=1 Tax=Aneurinibacillus sp. UBA3580 TaxID=1946041 RepID=UPI0025801DC3|nr:aldehyde dehydrogenase family protein [Aneurinibacillus sp. UBA3580]
MKVQELIKPQVAAFVNGTKKLLIGGQWVEAASGKTFETVNPAFKKVLCLVANGEAEDIDRAVKTARAALNGPWSKLTPSQRGQLLYRLAELIEQNGEELAQIETLDNGKPIRETMNVDIPLTVDHFRYYAGWATKIYGQTIPVSVPNYFNYTKREPVGVVGQIIPWNFPLLMAAWKLAAALACGNTVVLKPAEQTPLSALRLGELIMEAGFPDGVVNIVTGFGETAGQPLVEHLDVDKIAFTGSTEIGKLIMRQASGTLKKVSLELGGKSPNIILPDADMSKAIPGAFGGIFFNQGQVCCAGSRLYIHKKVYDNVLSDMEAHAKKLKVGNGLLPNTEMGPLVSEEQFSRVNHYIDLGNQEGASIITAYADSKELEQGYFVRPTVFADVTDDMTIAREEIFGPVLAAMPFDDLEDVIERANRTTYGLAAGVWTENVAKAHKLADRIKAGTVWVNCYNVLDAASPFGGYKQSGIGREMGSYALELYTEVKSVWVNMN